jgi:YHS domain-containing protein
MMPASTRRKLPRCALQLIETTQFRLTVAFPLAYTRLAESYVYRGPIWASGGVSKGDSAKSALFRTMSFLGRILRFLFWVVVVSWAVRWLGLVIGAKPPQTGSNRANPEPVGAGKRLVKDPVCGMHMAEELALPLHANGEVLHFCSEECRAKYEGSMVRRAASA